MPPSGGHRSSSSAFVPSLRPPDSGAKFFGATAEDDADEEEYEYEEIEIEEEIEVDEEVEVDDESEGSMEEEVGEDKEDSEIGVTKSPIGAAIERPMYPKTRVPSEFDDAADKTADDKCSGLPEGPIRNAELYGCRQNVRDDDIMCDGRQTEVHAGGNKDINSTQAVRRVYVDVQSKDCSFDITAAIDEVVDAKDAQVAPCNGKDISSEVSAKGETCIESRRVSDSKKMDEQLDMQSMDGVNKCSSSFLTPATMPRSLSPDAEFKDRDKRPAIVCRYFARGWCIKGDSCTFVHKRDDDGNTSHKLGGDAASEKCDLQCDKGSRGLIESPSSANGSQIASDRHTVGGSSSILQPNFSQLETGLAGFGVPFSSHSSSRLAYHRSVEEASLMRSQYMFNDHITPGFGHSINQYHMRNHSSSSSSLRQDNFGAHKLFTSNRPDDAFRSSWVQNPFPSASADMERIYHASISGESHISNGYKSKFIPHNWEQSTPFLSSFSVPFLSASALGRLDDTIHDSIEQPAQKNNSVKPSLGAGLLSEGTSSLRRLDDTIRDIIEQPAQKNISVKPSLGVGLLSEGTSDSWNADKRKYYGHGKNMTTGEAESVATSVTDPENRTSIAKDESSFGSLMNIAKASRTGVECGREHKKDALNRIELKVDGWKNSNIDVENAEYEDMHWASKLVKHFRAALIEFVKELMKPVWHEGHLTKDAYKFIVQKVEEKVTNSLLPNQIPSTSEHIKQYLSFSRTKLLKLIEAYADKYGKHVSNQALV